MTFIPRYQSEPSSLYSQSWNCGVTSAAAIAGFYNGDRPPIEMGRSLIAGMGPYRVNDDIYYGCPPRTPTSAWQQADMLRVRDVPATVEEIRSVAEVHAIVDAGNRPMILGLNYEFVPDSVAGHSFQDWHAVTVHDGGPGFVVVNDPNFWPGSADSAKGHRVYADSVVQNALNATGGTRGVVPLRAKLGAIPSTSVPPPAKDESVWINSVVRIEPRLARIIASPQGTNNPGPCVLYKGPGPAYPVHATIFESVSRIVDGYVALPGGMGLYYRFWEGDGTGQFFAPASRSHIPS